ncbi:MAG TPA: S8 family peptidase [Bacteroides sp.]|mgnify:CR=1 FL=1|nr:S8 family peptidase [Bacteroides sp.]
MKKFIYAVLFLAAGSFIFSSCEKETTPGPVLPEDLVAEQSENGQIIEGKYIVVFRDEAVSGLKSALTYPEKKARVMDEVKTLLKEKTIQPEAVEFTYAASIQGFAGALDEDQYQALLKHDKVKYIEPDRIIALSPPLDIQKKKDDGGDPPPQESPWGITRVNGGVDGAGKTAWIIDTGIDTDHPDLNVDTDLGTSVFTRPPNNTIEDGNGHGTHVAGTIAALHNEIGVVGVAAGATVVPVKVLGKNGSGSISGVIAGVDFVASNASPGDVANMSLGGPIYQSLDDAVIAAAKKEIIFTLAAGNEADDANNHSPARANGTNVYTISAMGLGDIWAYFSNYGNPPVDFCAPGVGILSTYKDGGYAIMSGTSMAAPHAAGVLLLGEAISDGPVTDDPDNSPDPIIVHSTAD